MKKNAKIYVAGNRGMVGSAITRKLESEGYHNLVFTPFPEFDLRDQRQVNEFFEREKPEYVFLAAAKVGGIHANNTYKAEFIYDNTMIEFNIIHASYIFKVKKLLFLGSSCIYPKNCPQPIEENYLLTSSLEPTNEPYAIAKIAGLKMCDYYRYQYGCDFISAMPTNLYGPQDNYNLETSHVLPAMIRKIHLAKCLENNEFFAIRKDLLKNPFSVNNKYSESMSDADLVKILNSFGITNDQSGNVVLTLWGSGKPYREFLFVDDLAEALLFLMEVYSEYGHVNVGVGYDLTINDISQKIKNIIKFNGEIRWDISKPDGTPRKLLNVNKIKQIGWQEKTSLDVGIHYTYQDYLK